MHCEQAQQQLDEYLDGALSAISHRSLQNHLNHCDQCRQIFNQSNQLLDTLNTLSAPPVPNGFEERMLAFVKQDETKKQSSHKNWFATGFSTAMAASFALWMIFSPVSTYTPDTQGNKDTLKVVTLEVQQQRKIDLVFNVKNDLHNVNITLELPANIQVAGYPDKQTLQWTTSLKKGTNRLALPLIASKAQNGILVASLVKEGKTKTFRIRINSQNPASSMLIEHSHLAPA